MEPFERVSQIVQTERGMLAALARAEGVSPEDAVDAVHWPTTLSPRTKPSRARRLEDLREVEQAVVTLRMLEQKPGEDVARVLGITRGHVAVLLHRAKHTLRTCMTRSA